MKSSPKDAISQETSCMKISVGFSDTAVGPLDFSNAQKHHVICVQEAFPDLYGNADLTSLAQHLLVIAILLLSLRKELQAHRY